MFLGSSLNLITDCARHVDVSSSSEDLENLADFIIPDSDFEEPVGFGSADIVNKEPGISNSKLNTFNDMGFGEEGNISKVADTLQSPIGSNQEK